MIHRVMKIQQLLISLSMGRIVFNRHAVVAEQRGEKRTLDRYQKSIITIENAQENKRKEKKEP
jgi:hypothetical protein